MIVVLYKSCFTNSVKGIGIFNLENLAWILNGACDIPSWIISSFVTVVWVCLSSFSIVVFSFSVWVSTVLVPLVFFSGIVWDAVEFLVDFVVSTTILAVAYLWSADFGSAVDVFGSKFVVLAELVVFFVRKLYIMEQCNTQNMRKNTSTQNT